jgi:hypothetical protein
MDVEGGRNSEILEQVEHVDGDRIVLEIVVEAVGLGGAEISEDEFVLLLGGVKSRGFHVLGVIAVHERGIERKLHEGKQEFVGKEFYEMVSTTATGGDDEGKGVVV